MTMNDRHQNQHGVHALLRDVLEWNRYAATASRGFVRAMLAFLALATSTHAADKLSFNRDVRLILSEHCYHCHGPDPKTREADLRLDTRAGATADLGGYAAIVPGDLAKSEMIARITSTDPDTVMPPAKHPKKLSERDKKTLEQWIREGAVYENHWAYAKPVRPARPAVKNTAWPKNEIDYFVLAKLEEKGWQPGKPAEKAVLLRRVSLDLVGLPPTPAEVDAFVKDTSDTAYEKAVDRLLVSPEFGVRWARPWLDLARYADSHGFQRDDLRQVWAYRDWVVDALNADKPFDEFTIEQVAGDLLPNATTEQKIATGFHRCTPTNVEAGSEPEETRINQVIDRVNTTGAVWLGATLECAQCHTHKYDPFTQEEYYKLLAYYNNTELEADRSNARVPGSIAFLGPSMAFDLDAHASQRRKLSVELAEFDRQIKDVEQEMGQQQTDWEAKQLVRLDKQPEPESGDGDTANSSSKKEPPLAERIVALLKRPAKKRTPQQAVALRTYYLSTIPAIDQLQKARTKVQKEFDKLQPPTTLVMRELATPRMTSIFNRGVYTDPTDPVTAGTPAVLHAAIDGPPNRLTLARWLVSPENPLTPRVTVNRWWAEVFGRGIVSTVEDFGVKGDTPSHPELLDWLAVEFVDQGWSLKKLLKQLVTSATYQQSSAATREQFARDDQNKWLSRGPRFRLDAEAIRDNALSIAGLISLKQGGPSIRPPQPEGLWNKVGGQKYDYLVSPGEEKFRRGIYVVLKRAAPYPSFVTFDASARMACVVKRSRSNTPLQALTLLNDPVYVEAALAFAKRIVSETPEADVDTRVQHAFRLALARPPREAELKLLRALYAGQLAAAKEDAAAARRLVGATHTGKLDDVTELAAWYAVASALMNLDETITKG